MPKANCTAQDYWALPNGVRAELIDGELWDLASPSRTHQEIVAAFTTHLTNHIDKHGGSCKVYPAPFAVNLFADDTTFVEPDISVVCDRSKLSDRGCEGAPDLVVEVVSPSSRGMDYISKLNLYKYTAKPFKYNGMSPYDQLRLFEGHLGWVSETALADFCDCVGDVLGQNPNIAPARMDAIVRKVRELASDVVYVSHR